MGHQVIKLQNPLKTLGFLQFYRFKTVKDRIISWEEFVNREGWIFRGKRMNKPSFNSPV